LHSGNTPAVGRTRMSANHQVTVPLAVAAASEIEPGDRFPRTGGWHRQIRDDPDREVMEHRIAQLSLSGDSAD